jgi:hypothetical protein
MVKIIQKAKKSVENTAAWCNWLFESEYVRKIRKCVEVIAVLAFLWNILKGVAKISVFLWHLLKLVLGL